MRVFLDANVLFSASNPGSNIARLVELVIQNHTAVTSDFALEEARRNVALKRSAWEDGFAALVSGMEIFPTSVFDLSVELEEKDRPIFCAAIASKCELLVTGDRKHFGHLYEQIVDGVRIVSVFGLAERLIETGD